MTRPHALIAFGLCTIASVLTVLAAPGQSAGSSADFEAMLRQVEAAQGELVRGRVAAFKEVWSHSEDATLIGGLGGAIEKGWPNVSARLDWVGTQFSDGTRKQEEIARRVAGDLAYVVQRETLQYRRPSNREAVTQELRVSMVFRQEAGRWRLVHRHADSQTEKPAALVRLGGMREHQ